jgi:putative oxidoreductase
LGTFLQRLFSTFANGSPGKGLLILRSALAVFLIHEGVASLAENSWQSVPSVVAAAAGTLLLAGLWTPIIGSLVALLEVWRLFTKPSNSWEFVLAAAIALALALLGPGAWSADALIFGRKRISVQER